VVRFLSVPKKTCRSILMKIPPPRMMPAVPGRPASGADEHAEEDQRFADENRSGGQATLDRQMKDHAGGEGS